MTAHNWREDSAGDTGRLHHRSYGSGRPTPAVIGTPPGRAIPRTSHGGRGYAAAPPPVYPGGVSRVRASSSSGAR